MPLLPSWCFNCRCYNSHPAHSFSTFLCSNCFNSLPIIDRPTCNHCGLEHLTSDCREVWARDIDTFQSLFYYRDPIHHWIVNHKYSGGFFAGRILKELVLSWFIKNADEIGKLDAVLPVPIHSRRLRQRGFNQTAFLLKAQRVLPMKTNWLRKKRHTPQQAGLSKTDRRENIRGAFAANPDVALKNVLVFDDVCTTGQTLGEVCSCLKKANAGRIQVLTLSRSM